MNILNILKLVQLNFNFHFYVKKIKAQGTRNSQALQAMLADNLPSIGQIGFLANNKNGQNRDKHF